MTRTGGTRSIAWGALMFAAAALATAGEITLRIDTEIAVRGDLVVCTVMTANEGNESARDLQVHVEFGSERYSSEATTLLAAGESVTKGIELPLRNRLPGRYHLVSIVDYTDTNGYPLTALGNGYFIHRQDAAPRVLAKVDGVELAGRARLGLAVKNLDKDALDLALRLVLPRELSAMEPKRRLALEAHEERRLEFEVRNFSALPGSRYAAFFLLEYEHEGLHSSTIASTTIGVLEPFDPLGRYHWPFLSIAALLAIFFLVLWLRGRF